MWRGGTAGLREAEDGGGGIRMCALALLFGAIPAAGAAARPISIVVIGDNNIRGRGVAENEAYPAQLERALRARGLEVTVKNAGRDFDTTTGVMERLDSAAPAGTDVAVVSIGVNDVVMHGSSPDASKANVREIARRLRARGTDRRQVPGLAGSKAGIPRGKGAHRAAAGNDGVASDR